MKKKNRIAIIAFSMFVIFMPAYTAFTKGDLQGTSSDNPYLIYSEEDLRRIGNDPDWTLDKHYKLMNNIYLEKVHLGRNNFIPIGQDSETPFTGVFDGNGKRIHNLTLYGREKQWGFFTYINGEEAIVKNLGLVDVLINGEYVGGIVASFRKGVIENCYTTGTITGEKYAGGIAGTSRGQIIDCYSTALVSCREVSGGIIALGNAPGVVSRCYFSGVVEGSYLNGGISGANSGIIERSFFNGIINSSSPAGYSTTFSAATGGIVGYTYAQEGVLSEVLNCYSTGIINGDIGTGGIVGENSGGIIQNCYSTASITSKGKVKVAGGITGYNSSSIHSCVALMEEIEFDYGLDGRVSASNWANVTNEMYSNNLAWDQIIVKRANRDRYAIPAIYTDKYIVSKTKEELTSKITYEEIGWVFDGPDAIWEMEEYNDIPRLRDVKGQYAVKMPPHLLK